jgi:hypothetical protein
MDQLTVVPGIRRIGCDGFSLNLATVTVLDMIVYRELCNRVNRVSFNPMALQYSESFAAIILTINLPTTFPSPSPFLRCFSH